MKPCRMAGRSSHLARLGGDTCTMLYGHIETLAHRVDHLSQLRGCRMRLRVYQFCSIRLRPQTTILAHSRLPQPSNNFAISLSAVFTSIISTSYRYWVSTGLRWRRSLSAMAWRFTRHNSGGKDFPHGRRDHPQQQTVAALEHAIRQAGRNRSSATVITDVSFHPKSLGHRCPIAERGTRLRLIRRQSLSPATNAAHWLALIS